jgi:hypothetical protein
MTDWGEQLMPEPARIPTPFSQRFRRFRFTVLPVLSFALCLAATLWLWPREAPQPQKSGDVTPRVGRAEPMIEPTEPHLKRGDKDLDWGMSVRMAPPPELAVKRGN